MSIWSENVDELEELMSDVLLQRLRAGHELDMTEEEIVDAVSIGEFVKEREGEDYLFNLMDEAMQAFIDRRMDAAESYMELKKDAEAEGRK